MYNVRIGVFDSGAGGQSVANAIQKALPEAKITLREDKKNLPYGSKTPKQLYKLVLPILQELENKSDIIVIACNTVSTTLVEKLRKVLKVPVIAMEPMVKPAAELTKSGVFAVCATPTTLGSKRYHWLKNTYAADKTVIEPDCSNWTYMIENNKLDREKIEYQIENALDKGADVIVLGCTHYHWIEDEIKKIAAGRAKVLQPEQPVIAQLKRVLAQLR